VNQSLNALTSNELTNTTKSKMIFQLRRTKLVSQEPRTLKVHPQYRLQERLNSRIMAMAVKLDKRKIRKKIKKLRRKKIRRKIRTKKTRTEKNLTVVTMMAVSKIRKIIIHHSQFVRL